MLAGIVAALGIAVAAANPVSAAGTSGSWEARLLGEQIVPKGLVVDGLSVGELSSVDYDRRTGRWFLISDDSENGPARFFTAKLDVDASGLHGVSFTGGKAMLRTDGSVFPSLATNDPEVADPEAMRFDPQSGLLWWSSEGKRMVPADGSAPQLVNPWVRAMTVRGKHLAETRQPEQFTMSAAESGPRTNGVFEGLTLTTDGRQLVTSLEAPLYQDGPVPTATTGGHSRLTFYDKWTGRPVRQLAYEISPTPVAGEGGGNGISEILASDRDHYLVVERSFVPSVGNTIRVYEVDVRGATNVLGKDSLADGSYEPVRKRLVLDLATLGVDKIDNIEGVSWGPRLRTGERTLVFVSDDNYNPTQIQQVIAVAIK
ncbi:esterase-like activity of phytase family protein [Flindersiella endophytica]